MKKGAPFFLDKFFKRNPQTSDFNEETGWGNIKDDTTLNGWGSFSGSSSRSSTNGWVDEPHKKHYNCWGSGSFGKSTTPKASSNGWMAEPPKDEYDKGSPGSASKYSTPKASSNGWLAELPKDGNNGWGTGTDIGIGRGLTELSKDEYNKRGLGSSSQSTTPKATSNQWDSSTVGKSTTFIASNTKLTNNLSDIPVSKPVGNEIRKTEVENDPKPILESRRVNDDTWADHLRVPSAPPLPDETLSFNEHHADNVSYNMSFDFIATIGFLEKNEGKNVDASRSVCMVCWEAPIEGACVPCGHMASCMACLNEINSKQGTCPVCRDKIENVTRIYAI